MHSSEPPQQGMYSSLQSSKRISFLGSCNINQSIQLSREIAFFNGYLKRDGEEMHPTTARGIPGIVGAFFQHSTTYTTAQLQSC
jgi:hypothetical protein